MHCWSVFGARTNHEQIWTHKTQQDLDLGEATTFPLIVYCVHLHEAHIQMAFCPETPQNWDSCNFARPLLYVQTSNQDEV
jgi:hypothetical protein